MFKRLLPAIALILPIWGCSEQKPVVEANPPRANTQTIVEPLVKTADPTDDDLTKIQEYANKVISANIPVKPQTRPQSRPVLVEPDASALHQPEPLSPNLPDLTWLDASPSLKLGPTQDANVTPAVRAETRPAPAAFAEGSIESHIARVADENPRDFLAQLDNQLMLLLANKTSPRLESLSGLSSEDREMLASLVDAISNLRSNARSQTNMLAEQKARPLLELADRVRAQAQFRVGTIALCTRVDAFGVYTAMTPKFAPGKDQNAVLYCEVENFLSRQNEGGQWETNLTQETVIYNEKGQRIVALKPQTCKDLCKNRRHDFFIGQQITIPGNLAAGSYYLRVTISDQNANRFCESTLPITISSERGTNAATAPLNKP